MFKVSRKPVGQALFVKLLQALKVFNVAMIALLVAKRGLAIDGRTIRHIALTEDARVGLQEMLRTLDGGVSC